MVVLDGTTATTTRKLIVIGTEVSIKGILTELKKIYGSGSYGFVKLSVVVGC